MSGHSHSANIAHRKGRQDAKKAQIFGKLSKQIIIAAQLGGGDIDANFRLKLAVDKAKAANMTKDTIERAIKKGAGELEGQHFEEVVYEGFAPAGVAVIVEALTDNRNRTSPEIRQIFERAGGKIGKPGSAAMSFAKKAVVVVRAEHADEEKLLELTLDAGAEEIDRAGDTHIILAPPTQLEAIKAALEAASVPAESAEVALQPLNTVELDLADARKVLRLTDALDDHDDVQSVSANYRVSDETLAALQAEDA